MECIQFEFAMNIYDYVNCYIENTFIYKYYQNLTSKDEKETS